VVILVGATLLAHRTGTADHEDRPSLLQMSRTHAPEEESGDGPPERLKVPQRLDRLRN
jgi:hypothetical protein